MKKIGLFLIVVLIVCCLEGCNKSDTKIKNYLNSGRKIEKYSMDVMPTLDSLPDYQSLDYKYNHKSMVIFESEALVLVVKYDDETFESEKRKLDEKYIFLNHIIDRDNHANEYIIPEYKFSINSFNFRVIEGNGSDNTFFPKRFGMVGISDESNSIAYLYFYDSDLDIIKGSNDEKNMSGFVKDYFKYDF